MRQSMFKFTPSPDVYEMCLRALLHSSKVHKNCLRDAGLDGEDDFGRVHSNFTEAGSDGPLTLYLLLPSVMTLGIALRSFLKTEIPEKHLLANEGRMLEAALGDFMGTVVAEPPKVINAKTLEHPAPTEEEKWTAKRDAIFRDICVPKSRIGIWGQEIPVEPETETRQVAVYYQGKLMKASEAVKVLQSDIVKNIMGPAMIKATEDGLLKVQVPKAADFIQINFKVADAISGTDPNEDLLDGEDPASFNERMKSEGDMAEHVKAQQETAQRITEQLKARAGSTNPCGEIPLGGPQIDRIGYSEPGIGRIKAENVGGSGASPATDIFYSVLS